MRSVSAYRRRIHLPTVLLLNLLQLLPHAAALQVLPGSNCTSVCSPASSKPVTSGEEIVCYDNAYNTTSVGRSYQDCVSCELASTEVDEATGQTNLGWGLYNMRYAVDWCVYNFPEPNDQWASNPCGVSCAPLSRSLQTNILAPNRSTPYDYCQDPDFIRRVAVCSNCYALIPNQLYISNFFKALRSGCQIQSPPSTTFAIPPSQIFTINPPATYPTSTAPPSSSNRLSRAGVLAIAIIIPVIVVLLLALFAIYWYKRFQKASANPRYPHAQAEFDFSSQYGDQSGIAQSPQEDFAPYPYPDGPQSFPSPGIPLQSQQYPDQKGKQRSEMVIMTESPIHSPYTPPPHSIREEEEGPSISRA